jgi:hypothetical protein
VTYFCWVQFEEQKDQAVVEKILRVVFLDIENPGPVSKLYEQYSVCVIHLIDKRCSNDNLTLIHSFSKQLEKLNNQLAEAEAALEARKKPPEENGPKIVGEGLVIDEWVCFSLSRHEMFWPSVWSMCLFLHVLISILLVFITERAEGKVPRSTAG